MQLPRDPAAVFYVIVLLAFLLFLAGVVVRGLLRRRERHTRQTRALAELGARPVDCCCCGMPAERPISRTGEPTWWDDFFPAWRKVSLKAQYRPSIPKRGIPSLCDLCGRTWDARLEHKVAEVVELALRQLHRDVADKMAAYEGGELLESMTTDLPRLRKKAKADRDKLKAKPDGVEKVVIVSPQAFGPGGIAAEPLRDGVPASMIAAVGINPESALGQALANQPDRMLSASPVPPPPPREDAA